MRWTCAMCNVVFIAIWTWTNRKGSYFDGKWRVEATLTVIYIMHFLNIAFCAWQWWRGVLRVNIITQQKDYCYYYYYYYCDITWAIWCWHYASHVKFEIIIIMIFMECWWLMANEQWALTLKNVISKMTSFAVYCHCYSRYIRESFKLKAHSYLVRKDNVLSQAWTMIKAISLGLWIQRRSVHSTVWNDFIDFLF